MSLDIPVRPGLHIPPLRDVGSTTPTRVLPRPGEPMPEPSTRPLFTRIAELEQHLADTRSIVVAALGHDCPIAGRLHEALLQLHRVRAEAQKEES